MTDNKRLKKDLESLAAKDAKPINVNEEMDGVEVRWMFTPDPAGPHRATVENQPGIFVEVPGRHTYNIIVRSVRYPHSKLIAEIRPEDVTSQPKVARHVSTAAGALAEELNERLGDNLDPEVIARAALQAFAEMVSDQKRALLQNVS